MAFLRYFDQKSFFQSVGTCSSSEILLKKMWSILAVASTSAFIASAGMLSGPAALPLLICLMAMLISQLHSYGSRLQKEADATTLFDWLKPGCQQLGNIKFFNKLNEGSMQARKIALMLPEETRKALIGWNPMDQESSKHA
ncbi:unnamed protein product [Schistosoma mattheei]|uniref:Uncharacterized protein n=1 Tax=Schistosoma mattheei TaxID=31246 RepID=A0A183PLX2_9TREM|nr:unnamed protein product [Schistosoma mattheei]